MSVFDYMVLPTVGQTYRAGDVEAVLLAVTPLEEGGWSLHFVLHGDGGLDKYHPRLVPTGAAGLGNLFGLGKVRMGRVLRGYSGNAWAATGTGRATSGSAVAGLALALGYGVARGFIEVAPAVLIVRRPPPAGCRERS